MNKQINGQRPRALEAIKNGIAKFRDAHGVKREELPFLAMTSYLGMNVFLLKEDEKVVAFISYSEAMGMLFEATWSNEVMFGFTLNGGRMLLVADLSGRSFIISDFKVTEEGVEFEMMGESIIMK